MMPVGHFILPVISLWQPWATAMAMGIKKNETRHWRTSLHGWVAIHAARRKLDREGRLLASGLNINDQLPYGVIVCVVRVVGCERTELLKRAGVSEQEQRWGDYSDGRWAWVTSPTDRIEIPAPIPLVGHQGLFRWPAPSWLCERIALVEAQPTLFEQNPEQLKLICNL